MQPDLCPYCATPMSDIDDAANARTKDHVFWEALGGRATLAACRICNSKIGSDIEGRLSRENELYTRHEWRGTIIPDLADVGLRPDGEYQSSSQPVYLDTATGKARPKPAVTVATIGNERHYRIEATPEQTRRILNDGLARLAGWDADRVEYELANAQTIAWSPRVRIEIRHDLNLGRRLAAKMLLGAGALADPGFVHTDLAETLRDILWARLSPIELLDNAALEAMSVWQEHQPALANGPTLHRPGALASAVFFPLSDGRTAGIVRARNHPVGLSGIVVAGTWPRAHGLPVIVEDKPGGARVAFLVDSALQWNGGRAAD